FPGPALLPNEARARARVQQIIGIIDNYAYRSMIWGIFVECVRAPAQGRAADEKKIASSLAIAETCLGALEDLAAPHGPALLGAELTLADLYLAPMMRYFTMAKEGADLLCARPRLTNWWLSMQRKPSMAETRSPLE